MARTEYRIEIERPTDKMITTRNREGRVLATLVSSVLIVAIPIALLAFLGSLWDFGTTGSIIGFVLGGIALGYVAPKRMVIINPEWCGYVTQNIFDKGATMVSYGPGIHASFWWEQRNADGNYSLKVIPQPFNVGVTTKSGKVIFDGEYEYAIDLPLMDRAIGAGSESLVKKGITAFIENFLTVRFADMESKDVRSKDALEKLGKELSEELMDSNGTLAEIHNKYGYKAVAIIIDKISLPEDVQRTRNAIDEAAALFEVVARLHGTSTDELAKELKDKTVTAAEYQKMLTRAMAVSDNKTTIEVKVIEGLEGSPAGVVAATLDALKGGKK